ncbi:hypothetical protein MYAM1_000083 [Malassezia yamatoensis]|uniref:histone acetyltransferase n=1 Tax=Malassezia yamatoensis TaxID=253288 RepID=A0AAJ5YQJ8_9BASI|nr:hypothetical protein MYAM1_000083 [Malassezia yamatoensis]
MAQDGSLLKACQAALQRVFPLSESGSVRIDTLFGRPTPVRSLYPLAHVHPSDAHARHTSDAPAVYKEHVIVSASWKPEHGEDRMMYALEMFVYTLPTCGAGLLYVSKLDSTGFAPSAITTRSQLPDEHRHAPSIIAALTSGVITYFASRSHWREMPHITHVSVHVLARAQPAYLFPSSSNHSRKHVLSDAALIRWWQARLSESIHQVRVTQPNDLVSAFYVIPGYSRLDSHPLVPLITSLSEQEPKSCKAYVRDAHWIYGHPYNFTDPKTNASPALPLHPHPSEHRKLSGNEVQRKRCLSTLVPIFHDDPKGRFINELCAGAHEPGHRSATSTMYGVPQAQREAMLEREALDRVSIDQFCESLGYRQECCSGNAVGVFVVNVSQVDQRDAQRAPVSSQQEQGNEPSWDPHPTDSHAATKRSAPHAQPDSLPTNTLENLILKHMLQDACQWSDDTQAVQLTRQYHEALDRAGQRQTSQTSQQKHGEKNLWTIVQLEKFPENLLKPSTVDSTTTSTSANTPPNSSIRVLSVKRKRQA